MMASIALPKQAYAEALKVANLFKQLADEESWLDYYNRVGIASPKTEENIAALRAEIRKLTGRDA
jgi:hypothetical protein